MAEIKLTKGIELVHDTPGSGPIADKGDVVTYNARIFLRRGDEVTHDGQSIEACGSRITTRKIDGVQLIDHTATLGKRQPIAAVEKSLYGMQAGGFREVLASPHLGYGEAGHAGIVPPNAVLRIKLWVHDVRTSA